MLQLLLTAFKTATLTSILKHCAPPLPGFVGFQKGGQKEKLKFYY